jgi:predicted Zn-dependent protease
LNHNQLRQAGEVRHYRVDLDLIHGLKQAVAGFNLSGRLADDLQRADTLLAVLRDQLPLLPDDPYLYISETVLNTETIREASLPDAQDAVDAVMMVAGPLDLVGIWASGTMVRGFANSLGQRNWHSQDTFNFDWSVYHSEDKAVKCAYAGDHWDIAQLQRKLDHARQELEYLQLPARNIEPGRYRVYLAPMAVRELLDMMSWRGFGLKSHKTRHTPLIRMITEDRRLHAGFTLTEQHSEGLLPAFTHQGFIKPDHVELIGQGAYRDCLATARSAREYDAAVNSGSEHPGSLHLAAGELEKDAILGELDTGLFVNNLWYCNFSDHDNCRITGMTRFACFWVEGGVIRAPVNVMRFDETVYNVFGEQLIGLTRERETIIDAGTYDKRSSVSYRLPGALAEGFALTL